MDVSIFKDIFGHISSIPDANHKGSSICLMTIGGGSTPDRNLSSSSKESSGNLNNPLDDSVMGGTNSSDVNPMDRTGIGDAQLSARKRNEEMFPTPSTKDIAEIDPSELDNFIKYLTIFPDGTTLFANAHVRLLLEYILIPLETFTDIKQEIPRRKQDILAFLCTFDLFLYFVHL